MCTLSSHHHQQGICYKERAAALETRLKRLDAELTEAVTAKRLAEQNAANSASQVVALSKSVEACQNDSARLKSQHKDEIRRRDEELERLELIIKKHQDEVQQAYESSKKEASRKSESIALLEKRYRDQTTALEQLMEESSHRQQTVVRLQTANAELTATLEKTKKEACGYVHKLKSTESELKHLSEKYDQLEAALHKERHLRELAAEDGNAARVAVQEVARDVGTYNAQKASLMHQVKALKGQVHQLKENLLEEKASREHLSVKAQRKLTAAGHEVNVLREKLHAAHKELQTAEASIEQFRSHCNLEANGRDAVIDQLRQQLNTVKRAAEADKRRYAKELQELEGEWQERKEQEIREAVTKHERRIQDLELQLTQHTGRYPGSAIGNGPPGSFLTTVLDYIPRAEHLRLLEARSAANEAESDAKLANVTAKLDREWTGKLEGLHAELAIKENQLVRLEADLEASKAACVNASKERDSTQRLALEEVSMLRQLCDTLKSKLETTENDCSTWQEEFEALDTAMQTQRELHEQHVTRLTSKLERLQEDHDHRVEMLNVSLETLTASKTQIENTLEEVKNKNNELQHLLNISEQTKASVSAESMKHAQKCADLEASLQQLVSAKVEVEKNAAQLHSQFIDLQQRYNTVVTKSSTLENELQQSNTRVTEVLAASSELEKRVKEVERLNVRLVKALTVMERQLIEGKQEYDTLNAAKVEALKSNASLKEQVRTLEATLEKATKDAETASRTLQSDHAALIQATHAENETMMNTMLTHLESCLDQNTLCTQQPILTTAANASATLNNNKLQRSTTSLYPQYSMNAGIGFPPPLSVAPSQQQVNDARRSALCSAWEQRLALITQRVHQLHAQYTSQCEELQRVKEDASSLGKNLTETQIRCVQAEEEYNRLHEAYSELEQAHSTLLSHHNHLQERYDQLEAQYTSDLSALESTARTQLQSVHHRAEETIDNLRRTSLHLQERLTGQTSRADSLAAEIDALQNKLIDQAKQAELVEERERELAALMKQVAMNLGGGGGAIKSNTTTGKGQPPPSPSDFMGVISPQRGLDTASGVGNKTNSTTNNQVATKMKTNLGDSPHVAGGILEAAADTIPAHRG